MHRSVYLYMNANIAPSDILQKKIGPATARQMSSSFQVKGNLPESSVLAEKKTNGQSY